MAARLTYSPVVMGTGAHGRVVAALGSLCTHSADRNAYVVDLTPRSKDYTLFSHAAKKRQDSALVCHGSDLHLSDCCSAYFLSGKT